MERAWSALTGEIRRAIESERFEQAERLLGELRRTASVEGDLEMEAAALFHEGMLADTKGDLPRAEQAFAAAVEVDKRIHGAVHEAVADALHSLAIVRSAAGHHGRAGQASHEAATIYEELRSPHRMSAWVGAGDALLRAEQWEAAERAFRRALEHPPTDDAPWRKYARMGLFQALVPRERYPEALSAAAEASREPFAREDPRAREAQGRIFCDIGNVSVVFGLRPQCAAAYRCALELCREERTRREAERGLAHVATTFEGPLDVPRVVHADPSQRIAHVLHIEQGLFVVHEAPPVQVGETVAIDPTRSPTTLTRLEA